ncbi:MAG: hypothetical protein IPO27_09265 [Bacteroidetes bacterium]|nr:hypothetical protein [Bacteroidota bacterium]
MAVFPVLANAQALSGKQFEIFWSDNLGFQLLRQDYRLTADSLVIAGLSDDGKSTVNYLNRKLSRKERKIVRKFVNDYRFDLLDTVYYKDFANLGYISYDHYPRVIKFNYRSAFYTRSCSITNCYVDKAGDFIIFLNQLLPPEVRISYKKENFKE